MDASLVPKHRLDSLEDTPAITFAFSRSDFISDTGCLDVRSRSECDALSSCTPKSPNRSLVPVAEGQPVICDRVALRHRSS